MPEVFTNGDTGSLTYPGLTVSNGTEILNEMIAQLGAAGWTGIDDQVSGSNFFTAVGSNGNHNCYLKVTNNTTTSKIEFQGSLDNTFAIMSSSFSLPYSSGTDSRLYLGAKESFVTAQIYRINEVDNYADGQFFGFLDNLQSTDQYGVVIGSCDLLQVQNIEIAKPLYDLTQNWVKQSEEYSFFSNDGYQRNGAMYITSYLDPLARQLVLASSGVFSSTSNINYSYKAYNGIVNQITGQCELEQIDYLESNATSEGGNTNVVIKEQKEIQNKPPKKRGIYPDFIVSGMSARVSGDKEHDPVQGESGHLQGLAN